MSGAFSETGAQPSGASVVFEAADRVLLRKCAEKLSEDLGGEPCERFDGMDQIFWDFLVAGTPITLHWKQGEGIRVFPQQASPQGEELARRIADHLMRRVVRD
jgi:hypothetical protein